MTRDEVLAALDASDAQVRARLTAESAERFGECTARELLFHIASWQRFFGATLRARREAGREATASDLLGFQVGPEESDRLLSLDTDGTNAYLTDLHRHSDWTAARRLWADGFTLLRNEVWRLSDAELATGEPLWQRIGLESFSHIAGHLEGGS